MSEEFDTVSSAFARGWTIYNGTVPRGSGIWQQGGDLTPWFSAFSNGGSNAGFIGVNTYSTSADVADISNWLISPVVTLRNGDTLSFYTRGLLFRASATDSSDYGNTLEVRLSTEGDATSTGNGLATGVFTKQLLTINEPSRRADGSLYYKPNQIAHSNPTLFNPGAYPTNWTRFEVTVNGIAAPTQGRIAFRYFVPGGGLGATAPGSGIAIDKVEYKPATR
ncbi:hypothetical protein GCM10023184_25610 [Flaviaesturariibacter amylovorans]|uniref:Uncharacterized protein n=1 Tax=Flaviaesturariibacter amylovorans TaxID=1084520 RepID=A0ABP8H1T3_9BACT